MGNINDLEYDKFALNSGGEVVVDFVEETIDPLHPPIEEHIEDLESAKFDATGKVRLVFTT